MYKRQVQLYTFLATFNDTVCHCNSITSFESVSYTHLKVITDYANMTADAQLERGAFRLASYEWGVTYSAMLAAAEMCIRDSNKDGAYHT